jgi:hypothetical protein
MRDRRRLFVLSGISLGGAAALSSQTAVAIVPSGAANRDADSGQSRLIVQNANQINADHARGMIFEIPTTGSASTDSILAAASYITPAAEPVSMPEEFLGDSGVTTLIANNEISTQTTTAASTADFRFKGESFIVADGMKNAQFESADLLTSPEQRRLGSQFTQNTAPDRSIRFDASRANPDQTVSEHWSGVAPSPSESTDAGAAIIK